MLVVREDLESTPVKRLVVTDPQESGLHAGECPGYWCPECKQADESLEQIWHDRDCSLAGDHGRAHYDDLVPTVPGRPSPELDPAHPITVVRCADGSKYNILGFRCDGCGNLDEDLFEVVHDDVCPLSGRHGEAHVSVDCTHLTDITPKRVADGGSR